MVCTRQQHLTGDAARVTLLDQLAPTGGEAKTGTGQGGAQAKAHQQQERLADRHKKHEKDEKGGHQGRQRESFHGSVWKLHLKVLSAQIFASIISCLARPGTLAMGRPLGFCDHSAMEPA